MRMMSRRQLFFLLSFACSESARGQDAVRVEPDKHTVEFENEYVRVVRVRYPAHARSRMHEHPQGVSVALTDCHWRITTPDGRTSIVERKAGDVGWKDASRHAAENASDSPIETINVEVKRAV